MKAILTFEDKWNDYSALNEQDIDNICNEFGYPSILISNNRVVQGIEFKPIATPIKRIISRQTFRYIDKCINRFERLCMSAIGKVPFYKLKSARNLNRKSKSHFRKI